MTVHPDLSNSDLARTEAELNAMHGTAKVEVDHNVLASSIAEAFSRSGLDKLGGLLSAAIKPTLIAAVGGAFVELAAAASQAVGAVALIPAGLAAIAVPAATVAIGVKGIGAAFKALDTGNLAKAQEAMAKLAPSARDFVTQIHALGPAWTALRLDVQQQLFAGIGTAVTNLAHTALPTLRTGLVGMAQDLNSGFKVVLDELGMLGPQFSTIFTNVDTFGKTAVLALGPVINAFVQIAAVGSQFLPALGAGILKVSNAFLSWTTNAVASGQLVTIIQNAINVITQLGGIALNVGKVVAGVFTAALPYGNILLDLLGRLTGNLAVFIHSADGQSALGSFFSSISSAAGVLLPALSTVVQTLITALLPAIGLLAETLAPIAATLLVQFASVLNQVAAIVPSVASVIGALFNAMAPLIPVIGQIITALLPPLVKFFGDLAPIIGQVSTVLGGALLAAARAIAPVLPLIGNAVIQILNAFLPLLPVLAQIVTSLLPPFLAILQPILPILVQVAQVIAQALLVALRALQPVLPQIVQVLGLFLQALIPLLPVIADLIGKLLPPLAQLLAALLPIIIPIAHFIADVLAVAIRDVLVPVLQFFITVISAVITALDYFLTHWQQIWGAVASFFVGIWTSFTDWWKNLWTAVSSWFVNQWNAFTQAWTNFWNAVWNFFQGLWNGLVTWIHNTWTTLAAWFVGVWNAFTAAWNNFWNAIFSFFQNLWRSLVSWVQNTWNSLASWFNGVLSAFSNAWNGVWNGIKTFFVNTWNDIVQGLRNAWGWLSGVLETIKNGFNTAVQWIGNVWHGLIRALEGPIQVAIDWVWNKTLRQAWNLINNLWNGQDLPPVVLPGMSAADGAILPGFTPGRDVHSFYSPSAGMQLNLSGGEAILRPEATAALGASWVHGVNAAARAGGVAGVRSVLGFDSGGIFPGVDWGGHIALGDRSLGWVGGLLNGPIGKIVAPLVPGGNLTSSLVKYVGAEASAARDQGSSPIFSDMGGMIRNIGNQLWTIVQSSVKSLVQSAVSAAGAAPGAGVSGLPSSRQANVAAVQAVAAQHGWAGGQEWNDLVALIMMESGFNNVAQNPTSTAYGIFQFLNSTWAGFTYPKTSNATQQAVDGLEYIAQRYRDPIGAYNHETLYHWFDQGGWLPPGATTVYNGTGDFEAVLNRAQQRAIIGAIGGGTPDAMLASVYVQVGDRVLNDIIDARINVHTDRTARSVRSGT